MRPGVPELLVPAVLGLGVPELLILVVVIGLVWIVIAAVRKALRTPARPTSGPGGAPLRSPAAPQFHLFLSYRRADAQALAGRVADHLELRFPGLTVFYDVDSLAPGDNFRAVIGRSLQQSHALLAVVDRSWTSWTASGRRRLDEPDDWVAFELRSAAQLGMPVIPLIDAYATMPTANMLPPDLAWFADQQAFYLHQDVSFDYEMARLDAELGKLLPLRTPVPAASAEPSRPRRTGSPAGPRVARTVVGWLVIVVLVVIILQLTWHVRRPGNPKCLHSPRESAKTWLSTLLVRVPPLQSVRPPWAVRRGHLLEGTTKSTSEDSRRLWPNLFSSTLRHAAASSGE